MILAGCLLPGCILAYTDYTKRRLYDIIVIPVFVAGLVNAIYTGNLVNALSGAFLIFTMFLIIGMIGGVGGGDIKLSAALGMWFGIPDILHVVIIGSMLALIWDFVRKIKKGVLKTYVKNRFLPFFKGIYLAAFFQIKNAIPKIEEDNEMEYIPYGTFLIAGAWVLWLAKSSGVMFGLM